MKKGLVKLQYKPLDNVRRHLSEPPLTTVYTRVQVERVYKSNPIFEAKNTTFLEKVWFF